LDIVERLRQGIERGDEGDAESAMDKAADEIERLRAALRWIEENSEEQNIAGYAGRAEAHDR
jgi:hypothetical protein